ncbi:MAG: HAD family hydrolase [Clostridia bacterium]|nr:HAD family hydrolase [Clostridia bacterium]
MKYDSIGFDLDGTLWNALDPITEAWVLTARKYNVNEPTSDEVASALGLNKVDLMNKLYPEMDYEVQMKFFDEAAEMCNVILAKIGATLFDGLEDTLSELSKHFRLYIVSNCQDGYIEAFFEHHGLGKYFCDTEHPDKRCLSKGENIKKLIERNGFKNSIYIGDTQGDADAAKFAGIPFIFASYGFGKVDSPDYTISSVPEILNIVL